MFTVQLTVEPRELNGLAELDAARRLKLPDSSEFTNKWECVKIPVPESFARAHPEFFADSYDGPKRAAPYALLVPGDLVFSGCGGSLYFLGINEKDREDHANREAERLAILWLASPAMGVDM